MGFGDRLRKQNLERSAMAPHKQILRACSQIVAAAFRVDYNTPRIPRHASRKETAMLHDNRCTYRALRLTAIGLAVLAALMLFSGPAGSQKKQAAPAPKDGTSVKWHGWSFKWSLRRTEGLVLSDVYFRGRKVLKYAGIAEIFTIYDQGEPRPVDFDQNGLGEPRVPIVPGVDCSSGKWCKVFDARGKDASKGGVPQVMMHEERTGPSYLGQFGRVPGKMLVLWSAGHFPGPPDGYTFIIRWKFRDDGTLIPEIGATGVPQHLATGDTSPTGAWIGVSDRKEKVFAPSHVHHFLYRLDFDVDGEENTVEEFNWEKDKTDPRKARCSWTPILKETGRPCNPETFRSWRVVNNKSRNALGHPRSYQLIPGNTGIFRGQHADKELATHFDLWVTRYKPSEFPRSRSDARSALTALPTYADGESVTDKDVVLWYWVGFHHFPRTEDWVHQPVVWKSFELMPRDFLDGSPLKPEK
jgi:primary-amine oxidase